MNVGVSRVDDTAVTNGSAIRIVRQPALGSRQRAHLAEAASAARARRRRCLSSKLARLPPDSRWDQPPRRRSSRGGTGTRSGPFACSASCAAHAVVGRNRRCAGNSCPSGSRIASPTICTAVGRKEGPAASRGPSGQAASGICFSNRRIPIAPARQAPPRARDESSARKPRRRAGARAAAEPGADQRKPALISASTSPAEAPSVCAVLEVAQQAFAARQQRPARCRRAQSSPAAAFRARSESRVLRVGAARASAACQCDCAWLRRCASTPT